MGGGSPWGGTDYGSTYRDEAPSIGITSRLHEIEVDHPDPARAGAYYLAVLGFALVGPCVREDAALEIEAYADLLGEDLNAVVLQDAIAITRGRDP